MPTEPKSSISPDIVLIAQVVFSLMCLAALLYLWVTGGKVPSGLETLTVGLVMFFFGGRLQTSAVKQAAQSFEAMARALSA